MVLLTHYEHLDWIRNMCTANLIDILDVPFLELQEGFNLLKSKTFSKGTKLCQIYLYIYINMGVSKNNGIPKMDGENHGKHPFFLNG